jgi:hypothetical protein
MIAFATRYEVSTHVDSSIVARQVAGDVRKRHVDDGRVEDLHEGANITEIATIHGLTWCRSRAVIGVTCRWSAHRHAGTQAVVGILSRVDQILTGTRCTTLT